MSVNFSSRKKPTQKRSINTVEAVFEACIQVLLVSGVERLTTTKVAERAGVSVGTLYQYFPNKESLLSAVLENYLGAVITEVEAACTAGKGQALDAMASLVVKSFLQAKMRNQDVSKALYAVSSDVGGTEIVARMTQRAQLALCSMLATVPNARFDDLTVISYVLTTALVSPVQGLLVSGAPAATIDVVEKHLIMLVQAYLNRLQKPDEK